MARALAQDSNCALGAAPKISSPSDHCRFGRASPGQASSLCFVFPADSAFPHCSAPPAPARSQVGVSPLFPGAGAKVRPNSVQLQLLPALLLAVMLGRLYRKREEKLKSPACRA